MGELLIRDFINAIFTVIAAASLSDDEFDALTIESAGYDLLTYTALLAVLDSREMVSNTRDRLKYYFQARGVTIEDSVASSSNVFLGASL